MDRIKTLYGPRTQAYGETNYLKEKLRVLDRTKALYGPRTQAYGETNYSKEKLRVSDTTWHNQTSVLGSETRCYQKYGQNSLLGYPFGWCILRFLFSDDYLMRIAEYSTVVSVSLISLIPYLLVLLYLIVSISLDWYFFITRFPTLSIIKEKYMWNTSIHKVVTAERKNI